MSFCSGLQVSVCINALMLTKVEGLQGYMPYAYNLIAVMCISAYGAKCISKS